VRLARLAWHTAVHWAYQTGLRGYCWVCDDLRWAWTHRRCARRQHAEATAWLAAHPEILDAARRALAEREDDDR
jgi:hypothetical protein